MSRRALEAAFCGVLLSTPGAFAQTRLPLAEKCAIYARDWSEALRRFGVDGVSEGFKTANEAFIRSGCASDEKVCPLSEREWRLVDALAVRIVNAGMSTTFLPISCAAANGAAR